MRGLSGDYISGDWCRRAITPPAEDLRVLNQATSRTAQKTATSKTAQTTATKEFLERKEPVVMLPFTRQVAADSSSRKPDESALRNENGFIQVPASQVAPIFNSTWQHLQAEEPQDVPYDPVPSSDGLPRGNTLLLEPQLADQEARGEGSQEAPSTTAGLTVSQETSGEAAQSEIMGPRDGLGVMIPTASGEVPQPDSLRPMEGVGLLIPAVSGDASQAEPLNGGVAAFPPLALGNPVGLGYRGAGGVAAGPTPGGVDLQNMRDPGQYARSQSMPTLGEPAGPTVQSPQPDPSSLLTPLQRFWGDASAARLVTCCSSYACCTL